jgi:hypothetical protein
MLNVDSIFREFLGAGLGGLIPGGGLAGITAGAGLATEGTTSPSGTTSGQGAREIAVR